MEKRHWDSSGDGRIWVDRLPVVGAQRRGSWRLAGPLLEGSSCTTTTEPSKGKQASLDVGHGGDLPRAPGKAC